MRKRDAGAIRARTSLGSALAAASLPLAACTGGRASLTGSPASTPLLPWARPLTQAAVDQEPTASVRPLR